MSFRCDDDTMSDKSADSNGWQRHKPLFTNHLIHPFLFVSSVMEVHHMSNRILHANRRSSSRQLVVRIVITCVIMLLLVVLTACSQDAGNANDENATSNADWSQVVAATVDGHDIMESDVNDFIQKYRKMSGYATDDTWREYLDEQSTTPSAYRDGAITQLEINYLIPRLAEQEGISVPDDDVDKAMTKAQTDAGYDGDDDGWVKFLDGIGYTSDSYRASIRTSLVVTRYADANLILETPTDAQMVSHASASLGTYTGKKVLAGTFDTNAKAKAARDAMQDDSMGTADFDKAVDDNGGRLRTVGWSGMSDLTTGCTNAIASLSAGQASLPIHEDAGYVIYYVEQEFSLSSNGTLDVSHMPEELRQILASDTAASLNASKEQEYLESVLAKHDVTKADMPDGLPYDVTVDADADSNENALATSDANASANDRNGGGNQNGVGADTVESES